MGRRGNNRCGVRQGEFSQSLSLLSLLSSPVHDSMDRAASTDSVSRPVAHSALFHRPVFCCRFSVLHFLLLSRPTPNPESLSVVCGSELPPCKATGRLHLEIAHGEEEP
jgi:hypothetical protein